MAGTPCLIREALETGTFLYTLEYVPDIRGAADADNLAALVREAELVGQDARVRGLNIGDRVKSLDSLDTIACGRLVAEASGKMPLLHLAGKAREPHEARAVYRQALDQGLNAILVVTGDGVPQPPGSPRLSYHDSAIGIADVKTLDPEAFVAAAVSPFKYREEELLNQYLKMAKKYFAGADYFITNCGWDMRKFQELLWYSEARGFAFPLVANLLLPTRRWARGIHSRRLPGVFLADDLMAQIESEYEDKRTARDLGLHRLALQIVGVKYMGYAGVQLSGIETNDQLAEVIDRADTLEKELPTFAAWDDAWRALHRREDGAEANFAPEGGFYLFGDERPAAGSLSGPPLIEGVAPSQAEMRAMRRLDWVDRSFFRDGSPGGALLGPLCRTLDGSALRKIEQTIKKPLLGCEMCGYCRIPHLAYVCPETCPKGLANGPCSGSDDNICEFKDRECVHNRKYRLAKALGRLSELETDLVPAVEGTRGTSSWVNKYRGKDPKILQLLRPQIAARPRIRSRT